MGVNREIPTSVTQSLGCDSPGGQARVLQVLHVLQELGVRAPGDAEAQLREILEIGCRELGLPGGALVHVLGDRVQVLDAITSDGSVQAGTRFSFEDSYCGAIATADAPICFPDDSPGVAARWPNAPAVPLGAYLGVALRIGGELFGFLSFGSAASRAEAFSAEEKQIVAVLGRHLEGLFGARAQFEATADVLSALSTAKSEEFFDNVARSAAEMLEVGYALVSEVGANGQLCARAFLADGTLRDPFEYDAEGTPCQRALDKGLYRCEDEVQAEFPGDEKLVEIGARSYLGGALRDVDGHVIGVISAFDTRPMKRSAKRERLLQFLTARVATGLARIRDERQMRHQRELFELASRAGHVGIWDMDLEANCLSLDENAMEIAGLSKADDALDEWLEVIHPADRDPIRDTILAHINGETEGFLSEHRVLRGDGTVRWVLVQGRASRDSTGRATRLISVGLDITQQKQLEAERQRLETKVQEAQRLESLGVLAGGLAHDFNNLLMGVLGNAGIARRTVQAGSLVDEKLSEIETAAQRAAELTNQMLAYSGRARFTSDSFDLNTVVEEMARLLRTVVSKKAALSLHLGNDALPIEADAAQVRQVVMNLITNASDALADQPGAVTIATGMRHFDRHFLSEVVPDEDLTEGNYAFLEVADTGVGMDEETRARIFDPFFTTKFTGRGLGLAAVLGIMRSHGGGIRVQSSPGEGTRAIALFPPAEADDAMLEDGIDDDSWEGQGAVLVVDDEEIVRNLMATVLEDAGFEVLTATDGVEALEIFEANSDRIRLILLDMMMPRMNGEEVYTEIRAKRPDTSIILMSGFSEEQVTSKISGDTARFLKKPFQIAALLDTVQDLLDS